MKVIHIVHGKANPNEHNGISRVVYYLNKYEKLKGCDSQIWAIVDGVKSRFTHRRDEFVSVECFPRVWRPWGRHEIIQELLNNKDSIDLVHFHLIWFYDKNIIAGALKKAGIPFIITTHGTYSKPHAYTGKRLLGQVVVRTRLPEHGDRTACHYPRGGYRAAKICGTPDAVLWPITGWS